ncbi:MAG TPA: superoxide dismutase family protein [Polyangiales bacterium]
MRSTAMAVLGAALLFGCGDDDGDGEDQRDSSVPHDASRPDAGNMDASVDASRDASLDAGKGAKSATATLASKSNSTVTGSAKFELIDGVVSLTVSVSNASPGEHGVHIHQVGNCDAPDATSAGGHWNPDMHPHGSGAADAGASSHLGDLGNILIAGDGKGTLTIRKAEWTLGDDAQTDVLGHAIVVHARQDDLVTQMGDAGPGNSGSRQACGVIERD